MSIQLDSATAARVRSEVRFIDWLKRERDSAVKFLVDGGDLVSIHRAQGKVRFIDDLIKRLDNTEPLR